MNDSWTCQFVVKQSSQMPVFQSCLLNEMQRQQHSVHWLLQCNEQFKCRCTADGSDNFV